MPTNTSPAPPLQVTHHLLGHPSGLKGHLDVHGPLNVARGRSSSWHHALVTSLDESGLTGRGGGDFPASIKLALAKSAGAGGTLVVNAMEGEPASDKDRLLLIRASHLVLDGAQYLAALCGSDRIVICVPSSRVAVTTAVRHAMAERTRHRYARVREEMVHPPDRFIAGEESALTNWIDSARLLPLFRPDKSIPLRIGKRPALVHNAETLAHIALIARHGPGPFRARGIAEEPGTCLVTLSGAVAHSGVVEVDRGTPMWDIALRAQPVERVQALLVGGYGGTWVGPEHFGTPYASISLRTIGAPAGVGVIVVLGETSCGVAESSAYRSLLGRSERWPMRSVRLRASCHRRRSVPAGSRTRRPPDHGETPSATARRQRARGLPASRRRGQHGAQCVDGLFRRHCRPRPRGTLPALAQAHDPSFSPTDWLVT